MSVTAAWETWNTCPDCGKRWADDTPTPGVVHRTRRCGRCVAEHKLQETIVRSEQLTRAAGAAARQAEIVAWLRAQAKQYDAKAEKAGRGWSDYGRLIDKLADEIEGAK